MNKWEHRENKLDKKKKRSFPLFRDTVQTDKSKRKENEQVRRDKEAIWDGLDSEGDE